MKLEVKKIISFLFCFNVFFAQCAVAEVDQGMLDFDKLIAGLADKEEAAPPAEKRNIVPIKNLSSFASCPPCHPPSIS